MDTKLRNIKYSVFTKFICWLMAVIVFSFAFMTAGKLVLCSGVLGVEPFLKQENVPFTESCDFMGKFQIDFFNAAELSRENEAGYFKAVNEQKEKVVDEVSEYFLDKKSEMIRGELLYAVENWDYDYYMYESSAKDFYDGEYIGDDSEYTTFYYNYDDNKIVVDSTVTTAEESAENTTVVTQAVTVPTTQAEAVKASETTSIKYNYRNENAPENVKVAEYALATKSGQEFLDYESLLREEALSASLPCSVELTINFAPDDYIVADIQIDIPYTYGKDTIRDYVSREYDDAVNYYYYNNYTNEQYIVDALEERENLKYYIVTTDGKVYGNIDAIPDDIHNKKHYVYYADGSFECVGFDKLKLDKESGSFDKGVVCLFFDEEFKGDDVYGVAYDSYKTAYSQNATILLVQFFGSVIIGVVLLCMWLHLVGVKDPLQNARLYFIDKLPNDIHFIISGALIGVYGCTIFYLLVEFVEQFGVVTKLFRYIGFGVFVVVALLSELVASVVRQKKAGESVFKNTLIFKLSRFIFRGLKKFFQMFKYKPKAFRMQVVLLFLAYIIINACLVLLTYITLNSIFFIFIIAGIVFNATVAYCLARYVKNLDKIIVASGENKEVHFDDKSKVAGSLVMLADNLSMSKAKLDEAVADAVKKEQMKTQLITNVSHDLKTPLTSLINYSDLLTKCNIDDEQAKGYIDTINAQSVKLKRLIEDLIEASKVSTGNVTLNKVKLNLCELTVQAIVEFTPEFEKNRNEVKFNEPDEPVIVTADSTKTYRVLSNLMSNARKYSAPNTRVYASVYSQGGYGCFELKNISREQLNISPDELTERFVRGDESRTNEGNGLGLSIAKDLCKLQGGSLEIAIDGDLFKVTVRIPL